MLETFDPATPTAEDAHYLREEYRANNAPSPALRLFYRVKPAIPGSVQLALRQRRARRQRHRKFPAWPIEQVLVRRRAAALARELDSRGAERLRTINPWPMGHRFAVILTHDVEGPLGIERMPAVLEVERRHGFVSSWNFVAEWYPISPATLDTVRSAGGEVGLHGLTHDGRLFRDRASFEASLPKIRNYLQSWEAVGLRSPSTLRNAAWMDELPVLYDSSFPDTDPFQPQAGGCCWIFPFFFGNVVELPITLDQDHTLFVLLREHSIDRWVQKSRWIIEHHGLINVNVHPDYMDAERLALYERFLRFLSAQQGGWQALPREAAEWWRERAALWAQLESSDGDLPPDAMGRATPAWARVDGERVVYES
jgi:peptidoglycan/xylan/chitin deacetylase (PgdA/CDA1 family)